MSCAVWGDTHLLPSALPALRHPSLASKGTGDARALVRACRHPGAETSSKPLYRPPVRARICSRQ